MHNVKLKEEIMEDLEQWLITNRITYAKFLKRSIDFFIETARRFVVKVLSDAHSITYHATIDMHNVACFFNALPFIVSSRYKSLYLHDDKVYVNKNIYIANPQTFKKIANNEKVAIVKKGKNIAYIDTQKVRKLREKEGLSLQQLADTLGISKKTAYLLERKNSVSIEIIEKIKEVFREDVSFPLPLKSKPIITKISVEIKPKEKPYTSTFSFPYDILTFSKQVSYAIIDTEKKAEEALTLHRIVKNESIFILKTNEKSVRRKIKSNLIQGQLLSLQSN